MQVSSIGTVGMSGCKRFDFSHFASLCRSTSQGIGQVPMIPIADIMSSRCQNKFTLDFKQIFDHLSLSSDILTNSVCNRYSIFLNTYKIHFENVLYLKIEEIVLKDPELGCHKQLHTLVSLARFWATLVTLIYSEILEVSPKKLKICKLWMSHWKRWMIWLMMSMIWSC